MADTIFGNSTARIPFLVLAALIILVTATPTAAQTLVLSNGEWPPFFSEHMPHGGMGTRIIKEAFAKRDIQVSFDYVPWKRGLELAAHGSHDGSVGWRKSDERKRHFLFSTPLLKLDTVFFHKKSRPFDWTSLEDVGHLKIGATLGYAYIDKLRPFTRSHNGKLELAPSDEINLRKLISGRIDVFPCSKSVGQFILRTQIGADGEKAITYHPQPLLNGPIYLLISKDIPDAQMIIKQFNSGLRQLKECGRYDHIIEDCMRELDGISSSATDDSKE